MTGKPGETKGLIRAVLLAVFMGLAVNLCISVFLDRHAIINALAAVRWQVLLVPFICYAAIYLIDCVRLKVVLGQFGLKMGVLDGLANGVLTVFFSNLTPMAGGGQPFQVYHLMRVGIDLSKAANLVLSRHVEYMLTSFALVLLAVPRLVKISHEFGAGTLLMYAGLLASLGFGLFFIAALARPDWLGSAAFRLQGSALGRLIGRLARSPNWGRRALAASRRLRREVAFLWTKRLPFMLLDTALGLVNLALQALSLQAVLGFFAGSSIDFVDVFLTFAVVNMVVYYIPTPGASGSIEGAYSLVFSDFAGSLEKGLSAIMIWRLSTYYLHILLGFAVFWFSKRAKP